MTPFRRSASAGLSARRFAGAVAAAVAGGLAAAVAFTGSVWAAAAEAPASAPGSVTGSCSVANVKTDWAAMVSPQAAQDVRAAIAAPFRLASAGPCTSIRAVLTRLSAGRAVGGRKLEDDKPLDVSKAEVELAKARASPEFDTELQAGLAGETSPMRRALVEAGLLHDFGHYLARDLLLARIAKGAP